jgi:hypothetical protein
MRLKAEDSLKPGRLVGERLPVILMVDCVPANFLLAARAFESYPRQPHRSRLFARRPWARLPVDSLGSPGSPHRIVSRNIGENH